MITRGYCPKRRRHDAARRFQRAATHGRRRGLLPKLYAFVEVFLVFVAPLAIFFVTTFLAGFFVVAVAFTAAAFFAVLDEMALATADPSSMPVATFRFISSTISGLVIPVTSYAVSTHFCV